MRFGRVLSLALALGVSAWVLGITPGTAQIKPPADFTFKQGKDSPGLATFSHNGHRAAGVEKCQECHTKVFKFKKGTSGPFTMAKMDAGELCGTCHNGKTTVKDKVVFATSDQQACSRCHKK